MTVRDTVSSALQALFSPPSTIRLPTTSYDLLTAITSWSLSHPTLTSSRLKLTDLKTLEDILVDLSRKWEHGVITVDYDRDAQMVPHPTTSQVTVTDVKVARPLPKKRKRENSAERG